MQAPFFHHPVGKVSIWKFVLIKKSRQTEKKTQNLEGERLLK